MQKKTLLSLVIFSAISALMVRCQLTEPIRELKTTETETIIISATSQERDRVALDFGKKLAPLLKQEDVRNFIKSEALKQFDGDYDILVQEAFHKTVGNAQNDDGARVITFGELLLNQPFNARTTSSNEYETNPLLQLSVPMLPDGTTVDDWRTSTHEPIVIVLTEENDGATGFVEGINSNGNPVIIDVDDPGSEPIIVISENERLFAYEIVNDPYYGVLQPYYESATHRYYLKKDVYAYNNDRTTGTTGSEGTEDHCSRDQREGKEEIVRFKFNTMRDLRDAEDWLAGAPELIVRIILSNDEGNFSSLEVPISKVDRSRYKECKVFTCEPEWRDINLKIVTWTESLYGDRIKYIWHEEDSGDPVKVSFEHSSSFATEDPDVKQNFKGNVEFTITHRDTKLFEGFVEYCDEASGEIYGEGTKASFEVRKSQ